MYLFEGEIGWMENLEEKIRRENLLEGVWLGEGEGKNVVGLGCFLSGPTKMFSLLGEKNKENRN